MTKHAVLIVGAGPTGMTLAAELALAGVDVALIERRPTMELAGSRAGGLHARTLELFDQRGIVEQFLAEGAPGPNVGFAGVTLAIDDFPSRHRYVLALWQKHIERILARWIGRLAVPVHRGLGVSGCRQDDSGVELDLTDGSRWRADFVIGCDGGGSMIRKSAGFAFPGIEPTVSNIIAEAQLAQEPPWGIRRDEVGIHGVSRLEEQGQVRILMTERKIGPGGEPTLRDLSAAMIAIYGSDFGVHSPTWISRFTDMTRQAACYRDRRILLAGDAAHVHPPDGGQGIQLGVQDAMNLGWKLAQVIQGVSPATLLDSYQAERHPVAARVLRLTLASVALRREDERTKALRDLFAELLATDAARRQLADTLTGLGIRYELGTADEMQAHPLLGRRMPDLDLALESGPRRLYELLHEARPVLLQIRSPRFDIAPWARRVQQVDARCAETWELPAHGAVAAPSAVLIRPDGHVAWVGGQGERRLAEAMTTWFGVPC